MPSAPPALLTDGQTYGALAAARCLDRAGVPVTLAEGHTLAPARWSRHVSRRVRCPNVTDTEAFLAWLLEFGAGSPGHVLLPSSDEVAWLVAENREALGRCFHLMPSSFAAIDGLLDKKALHDHCAAVGIDVPETRFPASEEEAIAAGQEVGFPLVLKPRTQVQFDSHGKGLLLEEPGDLVSRIRDLVAGNHYGARIRRHHPDIVWPMMQRFYPGARENIYGLSGYADGAGEIVAVRAARKILQRPRKLGIGLCFEEAPVDEGLVAGIGALCRRVGFQGPFEVEHIQVGSRYVLIDFNPRFYNQMVFDIDLGMPLPRMAYADALGDRATVAALAAEARAPRSSAPRVYCHRFLFELLLRGQRLSGRLSASEEQHWRRWWAEHRHEAIDAVAEPGDLAPWGADVAAHLAAIARHPRSFVRSMILDQ
jgi:D-aspartate ligase